MAIYEMNKDRMTMLAETSFEQEKYMERDDLQRLLRDQIDVVAPDTLIISEEFCDWEDSYRSIDLLGLDKSANLVVFELKRTRDGGHMDLQAIRYAAMVSTMTFDQVVDAHKNYLRQRNIERDARQGILDFLGWTEEKEEEFARDVSIVLVSADFSKELTTAVLWLNDRDLDIRCVRLKPYKHNGSLFLDIQQVIPLPEASEYQVRVKQKEQKQREAVTRNWDETSFFREMARAQGDEVCRVSKELMEWSSQWRDDLDWNGGNKLGDFTPLIRYKGVNYPLIRVWTDETVEIHFSSLRKMDCLEHKQTRLHLLQALNRIKGVSIAADKIETKSQIKLQLLVSQKSMEQFKAAVQLAVDAIKKSAPQASERFLNRGPHP